MKKILLSISMLFSIVFINAQSVTSMSTQDFTYSTGSKEAIKVIFEDVNAKKLSDALSTYFKKNYKAKVSAVRKTDGEFEVEEFKATDIQQKPTSALVRITELEGNAIMYIHYKSDGYVVSEKNTPALYPSYKKMTQSIANDAIALSYTDVIELKNKELADQQKVLTGFVKTEEKNSADVVKMESEIKTAEGEISRLETSLTQQKTLVIEKAKLVDEKKTEMATLDVNSLEKEIKTVQGDNKKADKEIEKVHADIAKKNAEIAQLQSEIKVLESEIETVNSRKESNGEKIGELQTKISTHNEDALKEQLKLLEKDSKDAVSEEKNITKAIEKERASIEKNKVKIKEAQLEIETSKASQETKNAEIAKTKENIKVLESKVSKLK